MEAADITEGPVFRGIDRHGNISDKAMTGRAVRDVIATTAKKAGKGDEGWSGHSLRRGYATAAHRGGATPIEIADSGGWERGSSTLLGYIDAAKANDSAPKIGL